MNIKCPYCCPTPLLNNDSRTLFVKKKGSFYRLSDRKKVLRFQCLICNAHFSSATSSKNKFQKKRQLNHPISRLLVAGVSQRECARIFKINHKTVVRKFILMGHRAKHKYMKLNKKYKKSSHIQFDDMEAYIHTKCKPVSITLVVEEKTRRILNYQVSQMPAKGLIASIAMKKYGPRKDERPQARVRLFEAIIQIVKQKCQIKSDLNPHYPKDVRRYFPEAKYDQYKGRRGSIVGQGELKKIGFDPIFSLNHTCARLREGVNRLKRRTWSTSKKIERLDLHLALMALHHNLSLPGAI